MHDVYSRLTISFKSLKKRLAVVHFFLPDSNVIVVSS